MTIEALAEPSAAAFEFPPVTATLPAEFDLSALRTYAPEVILAEATTDPDQLNGMVCVAEGYSRYEKMEVFSAVGCQKARCGDLEGAQSLLDRVSEMTDQAFTDPADELNIALLDAELAQGQTNTMYSRLQDTSNNMLGWALLKLHKYGVDLPAFRRTYNVETNWIQYNVRQQREIIQDVLDMGDTRRALRLAWDMTPDGDHDRFRQRAQRNAIVQIAEHRRNVMGDQAGYEAIMAQLTLETEFGLGHTASIGQIVQEVQEDHREAVPA